MTRRISRSIALVLIVAATGGCAGPPRNLAANPHPALQILKTTSASGTVDAADLVDLTLGDRLWGILKEDSDGSNPQRETYQMAETDRFDAAFIHTMGPLRTEFYAVAEDGAVVMPAVIEHKKNALTRLTPPLPITPSRLEAGTAFTADAGMTVLDARNPRKKREAGRAVQTIEYMNDQRIRTPVGVFDAKHIEATFTADLRLADAETVTNIWVVPGVGVIASVQVESITTLGIQQTPVIRCFVRLDVPAESTSSN